jgi:hypothetical protein
MRRWVVASIFVLVAHRRRQHGEHGRLNQVDEFGSVRRAPK